MGLAILTSSCTEDNLVIENLYGRYSVIADCDNGIVSDNDVTISSGISSQEIVLAEFTDHNCLNDYVQDLQATVSSNTISFSKTKMRSWGTGPTVTNYNLSGSGTVRQDDGIIDLSWTLVEYPSYSDTCETICNATFTKL